MLPDEAIRRPAHRHDFNLAVAVWGSWVDGKQAEMTGNGKKRRPAHRLQDLLFDPREHEGGEAVKPMSDAVLARFGVR